MAKPAATVSGLQPYPAYKPSGVEWLGDVPAHWEVRRLKTLCSKSAIYGANVAAASYAAAGVRFIRTTDITEDGILRPAGVFLPREAVLDYLLTDGDLLISRSGTIGRSFLYRAAVHGPCAYAGYLVRFVLAFGVSPEYTFLFTKTPAFGAFLQSMTISSTIENVNASKYANCPLPVPPLAEQAAIASYLDHVDRSIRRRIRAKQKLIALLKEQKHAIIHQAITGQIDVRTGKSYPAFKDSGVKCLGDVPVDWKVKRLKHLVRRIDQGVSPQAEKYLADSDSWGVLKAGCVNGGVFRESEHKRLSPSFAFDPLLAVNPGDVLVSRASGSPHLVGSVGRVLSLQYKLILSDKTFRPIFDEGIDPDFMVMAMNSRYYRLQVEEAVSGAEGLANNLPLSSLRSFSFLLPSISKQREIVEHLSRLTNQLSKATDQAARTIELLREYHTRLIADVVTGRLDVRHSADQIPDEIEEREFGAGSYAQAGLVAEAGGQLDASDEEPQA